MHIPDGFLNDKTNAAAFGAAAVGLFHAARIVRARVVEKVSVMKANFATYPVSGNAEISIESRISKQGRERIWRMATVGSLVFAAQTINFPIGDGTSGHLIGGVLAAVILGPFEALIVMTVILFTQAFVFSDGGVIALSANIVNMGLVAAVGGYYLFKLLFRKITSVAVSVSLSAWFSVILAAIAVSLELSFSGVAPLSSVIPLMLKYHFFIGLGEALITLFLIDLLLKSDLKMAALEETNDGTNHEN